MTDVLIAGGGIAGSSLAIMLGRAGVSCEVFERDRFPRETPCGEGIMPAGVAVLERLGLAEAAGGAPFYGVRYLARGVAVEARFPTAAGLPPAGRGQRRLRLDRALFEAAAATAGVTAHTGATVQAPLQARGRVRGLTVNGREYRAPLVVVADGSRSRLRRQLGLDGPPPRRVRIGVRTHFRLAPGQEQPPWVEVYLGRGHELYVTPLAGGELLVAALAERSALRGGAAASVTRWIAAQPTLAGRLRGATQLTAYAGRAPLASTARAGVFPGAVLLGDAAGFVDPVTGGGIAQALTTAELLARHTPHILARGDAALARFDRERAALLRDSTLLTHLVLGLTRYHWLALASLRLMRAAPPLLSHLAGVAAGNRRLLPPGTPSSLDGLILRQAQDERGEGPR